MAKPVEGKMMARRLINPLSALRAGSSGSPVAEEPDVASGVAGVEAETNARVSDGIEGRITSASDDAIMGWAWNPAKPYEPLEIEVFSGGLKLGHARADIFDIDLARAKIGNGMHRFEIRLDRLPPGTPPFHLRMVVAGTDNELNPPVVLSVIEDAERLLARSEYVGRVTGIENGMICGWVVNRRNPHEAPVVALQDGDRRLLEQPAREAISVTVAAGVASTAYRFELPLPASLLDGMQHRLSVVAGKPDRDLEGSPILFGPSDISSVNRSVVSAMEKLQRLERKIETIEPLVDQSHFERRLTTGILDRIDMLLNIHRDSIEREMAVFRRQIVRLTEHVPAMDADLIDPLPEQRLVEHEQSPAPITFTVANRAVPQLSFNLAERKGAVTPTGGIKWTSLQSGDSGCQISGSGRIEFNEAVSAPASLILSGGSARDPFELCALLVALDGRPVVGRFDISDKNAWTMTGTTADPVVPGIPSRGLAIEFLPGAAPPKTPLTLRGIALFGHKRVPLNVGSELPASSIMYLGIEQLGKGWYAVETNRRGGVCWMGAYSETPFHLRASRSYRFFIPEVRPIRADLISRMQISIGGVQASVQTAPLPGDRAAFSVSGECSIRGDARDELNFEISFPSELVRSPKELDLNNDERPLTIAVRAIALSAAD